MKLKLQTFCILTIIFSILSCKASNKKGEPEPSLIGDPNTVSSSEHNIKIDEYKDSGEQVSSNTAFYFKNDPDKYQTRLFLDFNLSDLDFFEKNKIKPTEFDETGNLIHVKGGKVEDGCYQLDLIQHASPYIFKLHMLLVPEEEPTSDYRDSSYSPVFSGKICVSNGRLIELNNKNYEGKVAELELVLLHLDASGFITKEASGFHAFGKAFKKLGGGRNYGKLSSDDLYSSSSSRSASDIGSVDSTQPIGSSPTSVFSEQQFSKAKYIAEQGSLGDPKFYDEMSKKFIRNRGSDTPSGSTNEVFFGSIDGKEGGFIRRRMQASELTDKKLKNAKKERKILIALNQTNLGNSYGRTMIPQNLAINSNGTESITQTLYPLTPAHLKDNFFPLADLRAQNISLAETIEFLHTPKQIVLEDGRKVWISVAHRDLKAENFLQQSETDFRAAVTDFDLSEIQTANTLPGLRNNFERRIYVTKRGTPDTLDPNIFFKNPGKFSFRELMASDVWSMGITMLQNTFGTKMFDKMLKFDDDTTLEGVQDAYKSGVTNKVQKYFTDNDDAQIRLDNPEFTDLQIKRMREFVGSKDFEILEEMVLKPNWTERASIEDIVKEFKSL